MMLSNRGFDYFSQDAGTSIFRLIAADVIETDAPILNGMCLHPTERVQLALAREKEAKLTGEPSDMPPFIFCVNISSMYMILHDSFCLCHIPNSTLSLQSQCLVLRTIT